MIDGTLLLTFLAKHQGKANGITAKDLVAEINASGRAKTAPRLLRRAIEKLRSEGHHVCAHPSTGYYLAVTQKEIDETITYLHGRAMCSLHQIAAMKRVSVGELLGQMRLQL